MKFVYEMKWIRHKILSEIICFLSFFSFYQCKATMIFHPNLVLQWKFLWIHFVTHFHFWRHINLTISSWGNGEKSMKVFQCISCGYVVHNKCIIFLSSSSSSSSSSLKKTQHDIPANLLCCSFRKMWNRKSSVKWSQHTIIPLA